MQIQFVRRKAHLQKRIEENLEVLRAGVVLRMKLDGEDGQVVVDEALVWAVVGVGEQRMPGQTKN